MGSFSEVKNHIVLSGF